MSKLPDAITTIMESSINRYLALDPDAGDSIDALDGKTICLQVREFSFPVYFNVQNRRIKVLSSSEHNTDVKLRASVIFLVNMAVSGDDSSVLGSELEMSGDMDVGRQFSDIFKNLDIDWEEILSRYTGDIVAHKLGNGLRHFTKWLSDSGESLKRDVTEYLQEESQQLPSASEVNEYVQQVDDIRLAVERAEARAKLLRAALENSNG